MSIYQIASDEIDMYEHDPLLKKLSDIHAKKDKQLERQ